MDNYRDHEVPKGWKLTAVTIGYGTRKIQMFVKLPHDDKGHAILPLSIYSEACRRINAIGRSTTVA